MSKYLDFLRNIKLVGAEKQKLMIRPITYGILFKSLKGPHIDTITVRWLKKVKEDVR